MGEYLTLLFIVIAIITFSCGIYQIGYDKGYNDFADFVIDEIQKCTLIKKGD